MNRRSISLFFGLSLLLDTRMSASAETAPLAAMPAPAPKLCTDYPANHHVFDGALQPDPTSGEGQGFSILCAANHGVIATASQSIPRNTPPEKVYVQIHCCPLPAPDILLDEHSYSSTSCPDNHIATGITGHSKLERGMDSPPKYPWYLRCTRLNKSRYRLGEETKSAYWGFGFTFWRSPVRYMRRDIPLGMRYAVGRSDRYHWAMQGCIGQPFGSYLTGKASKYCNGVYFRELQFSGAPGDPPAGTAVPVILPCERISDILDPAAQCLY